MNMFCHGEINLEIKCEKLQDDSQLWLIPGSLVHFCLQICPDGPDKTKFTRKIIARGGGEVSQYTNPVFDLLDLYRAVNRDSKYYSDNLQLQSKVRRLESENSVLREELSKLTSKQDD